VEARRDFDSYYTRIIVPTIHYFDVARTVSNPLYTLPKDGYEVELKLDRQGRVKAVVERWFEG